MPLRLRDPNLVLDLEFSFAEFRNGIRDGAPMSEIRASAAEIRAGLLDVDRTLADKGFAAPALAFTFAFAILFREGVEVVLLLAILLGALSAGRASGYRKPLAAGVIAALAATALTWVLATRRARDRARAARAARGHHGRPRGRRPLRRQLLARLAGSTTSTGSNSCARGSRRRSRREAPSAFAGLGFTAVYREGFETVLFYQALSIFAAGSGCTSRSASATAVVALAVVAYMVLKLGRRIPVKPMLTAGAATLLLLSVTFAGNAVRSLQGADWVSITPVAVGLRRGCRSSSPS